VLKVERWVERRDLGQMNRFEGRAEIVVNESKELMMSRILHGETLPLASGGAVDEERGLRADDVATPSAPKSQTWPFWYIFSELQDDPSNLLSTSEKTVESLKKLGSVQSMADNLEKFPGIPVPTIYTFFGQFVDHDITLEKATEAVDLSNLNLTPLSRDEVKNQIVNSRSPNLELDSVYGDNELVHTDDIPRDPANNDKMLLGIVSNPASLPLGKDIYNDLPRRRPNPADPRTDRAALIGDSRNDENLIVAQLHVAFLRAHNALIDRLGCTFDEARKLIIQHYQWIVLNDFLGRVADPAIVKKVRYEGPSFFNPTRESFFMPLEFSVAAYRFGHSKVREFYLGYNRIHLQAQLFDLFTFTKFSGRFGGLGPLVEHIPGDWVIDWTNFLRSDNKDFFSRPIDTMLAQSLLALDMQNGIAIQGERNLAIRNLLRGYILRLPTGQAVARAMSSQGILPLSDTEIASVAANSDQLKELQDSGFLTQTPLWFYILAEAVYYNKGQHLGPVGSTIVAEVLIGVLRFSDYSILSEPNWKPTLGQTPNKFDLKDFLRLANVL